MITARVDSLGAGSLIAGISFSLLFALACVAPTAVRENTPLQISVIEYAVLAAGAFAVIAVFCLLLRKVRVGEARSAVRSGVLFAVLFVLALLVYALSILTCYPGMCSPDSVDIINQALGSSHYSNWHRYEGLSAHHPLAYTFFVWVAFQITAFAGDMYVSICAAIAMQAVFIACMVSVAIVLFHRAGAPRWATALATVVVVLVPVLPAHVVTLWKDGPFASAMLMLVASMYYLMQKGEPDIPGAVALGFAMLAVCLLRSNGTIVCAVSAVVLLLAFKRGRAVVAASFAGALVVTLLVAGPVCSMLSINKAHVSEAMAMPIQQVALSLKEGDVSAQDREFLAEVLPARQWTALYNPSTPNPIKFSPDFDDAYLESHKFEFVGVWLRNMPANFPLYCRAWMDETCGYWMPGYESTIGYGKTIGEADAVDVLQVGTTPAALANSPRIRGLAPMLFGMGWYIWLIGLCLIVCGAVGGKEGLRQAIVPLAPVLALFATLLVAAPIADDFRYVLPLYLTLAFLPCFLVGACRARRLQVAQHARKAGAGLDEAGGQA